MFKINTKSLVKNGEIILPTSYTPTPEEEEIFKQKNIKVIFTNNKGQLFQRTEDGLKQINPLKSAHPKKVSEKIDDNSNNENINYTTKANFDFSKFPKVKTHTALNEHEEIFKGSLEIRFRGELDDCIAHTLFLQTMSKNENVHIWLNAIRSILGNVMAATCIDIQLEPFEIDILSAETIHKYSHNPMRYLNHDHIVSNINHNEESLRINTLRTKIRLLENTAFNLYATQETASRPDILNTLNRLSSACYVLMIMLAKN